MAKDFAFDDEDDEKPRKKARRPADDEDDDEPPPPKRKSQPIKPAGKTRRPADDEEEAEEDYIPRQRRRAVSINPLQLVARFVSPVPFLFTIVLFFLPWTDIGCRSKDGTKQLLSQSGFQSAYGSASEGSFAAELGKMGNAPKDAKPADLFGKDLKNDRGGKEIGRAILLWPYMVVLMVGLALPIALPGLKPRGIVTAGLAAAAAFLLAVQVVALGMPLRNAAEDVRKEFGANKNAGPKLGPAFPEDTQTISSSFLASFYASVFLLLITGVYGLAQVVWGITTPTGRVGKRVGPRRGRRRPTQRDEEDD